MSLIEQDMANTLPGLHIFHHETGPLYSDLREMLCAWVVSRSDEGLGYTLGAAKIAAMLLVNMPVEQGFVVMRNLLERHCMRSFFGGDGAKDDVSHFLARRFRDLNAKCRWRHTSGTPVKLWSATASKSHCYRIFDTLLADGMPKSDS